MQADGKERKSPKSHHYWSVMFVGDHGRVIPFRHFKALSISVFIILTISIAAGVVFGFLYYKQRQAYNALRYETSQTDLQSSKLRDEKDLCLAKLVALKKQFRQTIPPVSSDKNSLKEDKIPPAVPAVIDSEKNKQPDPKPPVKELKEPGVKWMADIRNFEVSYEPLQRILKVQYRIYNTSLPKKAIAGNSVVVLKKKNDPDHMWATIPSVPLKNGQPVGDKGKDFKINNYRTERFRITHQIDSADYDTASIYVFTEDGTLICHLDKPFTIDYHPLTPGNKKDKTTPNIEASPSDEKPAIEGGE